MSARLGKFRNYLEQRTGVAIEADRDYMIEMRLMPVLRTSRLPNAETLVEAAMSEADPRLTQAVIEAMLTGETFFFRDRLVFDAFRDLILPEMIQARKDVRRLRIWCAASSTGQEPYSVAMLIDEEARALRGWNVEIIATDLSQTAVDSARSGFYNQFEVQRGLPVAYLLRYFVREQERWRIAEHLRSRVDFSTLNLKNDFASLGQFDVIFCRNVLMYFDTSTKRDILGRLSNALAPDGHLFIGATENTTGLAPRLEGDHRIAALYRRKVAKVPAPVPHLARAGE